MARGVDAASKEEIRKKAFPLTETGKFREFSEKNASLLIKRFLNTAGRNEDYASYISRLLSPEWLNFFKAVNRNTGAFNPLLSVVHFVDLKYHQPLISHNYRPLGEMSMFINVLVESAKNYSDVNLYLNEEVQTLDYNEEEELGYIMRTDKWTVHANKVVIAIPQKPFSKLKGKYIHIFGSVVS